MAVLEWSKVSSSRVDTTPRQSVNEPAAELMRPWSARPRKESLALMQCCGQAAKQQDGREDKGRADPEELRTDDSSWRHKGGRVVRVVDGGPSRAASQINGPHRALCCAEALESD